MIHKFWALLVEILASSFIIAIFLALVKSLDFLNETFDCIHWIYPKFTIMFYSISKQSEWSKLIGPDYYEQMECQYGIKLQLCLIWLSLVMRLWFSQEFQRAKIMLWKAFWLFHSNIFCAHKEDHLCLGVGEPIKELVTAIPLHVMSSHYNTNHLKQI